MLIFPDALGRTRTFPAIPSSSVRRPSPRSRLQAPSQIRTRLALLPYAQRRPPNPRLPNYIQCARSRSSHTRDDETRSLAHALRMPLRDPPAPPTSATAQSAPPALHVSMRDDDGAKAIIHPTTDFPSRTSPSSILVATPRGRTEDAIARLPTALRSLEYERQDTDTMPRKATRVSSFGEMAKESRGRVVRRQGEGYVFSHLLHELEQLWLTRLVQRRGGKEEGADTSFAGSSSIRSRYYGQASRPLSFFFFQSRSDMRVSPRVSAPPPPPAAPQQPPPPPPPSLIPCSSSSRSLHLRPSQPPPPPPAETPIAYPLLEPAFSTLFVEAGTPLFVEAADRVHPPADAVMDLDTETRRREGAVVYALSPLRMTPCPIPAFVRAAQRRGVGVCGGVYG
ncbi:hypothetical protein C8J57DRAFT_1723030 [Mycena rebaudengoi]|nr:hypothetical protein C8J57DRAFT_1723030 [Mycena rebaudengoi]